MFVLIKPLNVSPNVTPMIQNAFPTVSEMKLYALIDAHVAVTVLTAVTIVTVKYVTNVM